MKDAITISRKKVIVGLAGAGVVAAAFVSGCGIQKAFEPFNDAPISFKNDSSAVVGSMPDGFSNWATKCAAKGIRIVVAFHGDGDRAAIAAVQDPNCTVNPADLSRP